MPLFRVSFEVHMDVDAADVEEARGVVTMAISDLTTAVGLIRTDANYGPDYEAGPEAMVLADTLDALAAVDGLRVVELAQDGAA